MPEFATTPPIPYVPIGEQAAAVRSAIDVYSTGQTYSQLEVNDLLSYNGLDVPDTDAILYIADVEAALGTTIEIALPSATNPKRIISDFIKAEKAASRWSLHKWLNLTIFNNSAASSIDMVARNVGQFALSGVTHAAGYVQGNGTSGYFDTLINWNTFATVDNATIGTINLTGHGSPNMTSIGVGAAGATVISVGSQNSGLIPTAAWAGAGIIRGAIDTNGIQMASRSGGVTRMIRRSASGITEDTNSAALTGSAVNAPITLMCRRTAAGANFTQYSNAQIGGGIISLGMDSTQLAAYSLSLKNLYESLTGLTLP